MVSIFSHSNFRTIPHRSCRLGESAYSNPFTGSVQIRENPCSPFHPCSISTKQLDTDSHLLCLGTPSAANGATLFTFLRGASARDHFFNQKSSASDIFNIDLRLTTVEFWSAPAWRSFLSQSALSALSLTGMKRKAVPGHRTP